MKFKANSDAAPQNANGGQSTPSVPLSVYRELAAELQATRAMVDSLNLKNQTLTQQNQTLRQEMQRVVHTALSIRPLIEPSGTDLSTGSAPSNGKGSAKLSSRPLTSPAPKSTDRTSRPAPLHPDGSSPFPTLEETAAAAAMADRLRSGEDRLSNDLIFEQDIQTLQGETGDRPRNLGGLWLTCIIVLIVVTAFGAGFLVVRPLLPNSR